MTEDDRNNICKLMCLVVLADKRVFVSEINTLVQMMLSIQDATHVKNPMDGAELRDWFADHRYEIESILNSDQRHEEIIDLFKRLDHFRYKPALLEALAQIAVADDVLHSNEIEILKLGAEVWKIEPPEGLR